LKRKRKSFVEKMKMRNREKKAVEMETNSGRVRIVYIGMNCGYWLVGFRAPGSTTWIFYFIFDSQLGFVWLKWKKEWGNKIMHSNGWISTNVSPNSSIGMSKFIHWDA
jgi:hypothetical protein